MLGEDLAFEVNDDLAAGLVAVADNEEDLSQHVVDIDLVGHLVDVDSAGGQVFGRLRSEAEGGGQRPVDGPVRFRRDGSALGVASHAASGVIRPGSPW